MALTILETRVLAPGWLLGTENFEMLLPKESNNLTLLSLELTSMPTSNELGIRNHLLPLKDMRHIDLNKCPWFQTH